MLGQTPHRMTCVPAAMGSRAQRAAQAAMREAWAAAAAERRAVQRAAEACTAAELAAEAAGRPDAERRMLEAVALQRRHFGRLAALHAQYWTPTAGVGEAVPTAGGEYLESGEKEEDASGDWQRVLEEELEGQLQALEETWAVHVPARTVAQGSHSRTMFLGRCFEAGGSKTRLCLVCLVFCLSSQGGDFMTGVYQRRIGNPRLGTPSDLVRAAASCTARGATFSSVAAASDAEGRAAVDQLRLCHRATLRREHRRLAAGPLLGHRHREALAEVHTTECAALRDLVGAAAAATPDPAVLPMLARLEERRGWPCRTGHWHLAGVGLSSLLLETVRFFNRVFHPSNQQDLPQYTENSITDSGRCLNQPAQVTVPNLPEGCGVDCPPG